MYGYNASEIEEVLANCPLTCKVCFPPPEQPGSGDTIVYKVTGSVSFTVPASQNRTFVDSITVRDAMESAIADLAGPLAGDVGISFVTGDEVQGIPAFCDDDDCEAPMVLKLDADLPDRCAGSACTSTECCTSAPICTSAACDAETHVIMLEPPAACATAICQQEECCDFRATCSADVCPNTTHVMVDDPPLCEAATCTAAECCVEKGTCTQIQTTTPSVLASGGPSSGPSREYVWMGCPSDTHVDKAVGDLPTRCEGAECTIFECCAERGICNVTEACNEDTHVPRDRNGVPCPGQDCTVSDCCDPRDQCASSDCAAITSTHIFVDPGTPCWGTECTESECCEFRASCAAAVCSSGSNMRLKASPPLCRGTACTQGECCEYNFANYKRSNDFLTTAIADTAGYSTASDAIDQCNVDGTCSGITCPVNSDGMAIGPCHLRASGASTAGDGTSSVSFVSIACAVSDCGANQILKTGSNLPETCTGGCNALQCCDDQDTCVAGGPPGGDCPASHIDKNPLPALCAGAACLQTECCDAKDTCEAADCDEATQIPKENLPLYCPTTACVATDCCDERAECDAAVCGDTHVLKPAFFRMNRCLGTECTLGECCNPRGVCQEDICNLDTQVFDVQTADASGLCVATRCTASECCSDRAECTDVDPCGETHVLRGVEDPLRVAMCLTNECTPDECCEERGHCDAGVCNTVSTLKPDAPDLCAAAACTNDECCDVCPFVGDWQSTSVFGGDALNIVEATCESCIGACDSDYFVQIAAMPGVQFCFRIEAGCGCEISLDELTIAHGQMSDQRDAITWDMILNNDVWEPMPAQDRRLHAERNYEVKAGGGIIVLPDIKSSALVPERRLQQTDVRMEYEIDAASPTDALAISGILREITFEQFETALQDALQGTDFSIGAVYMVSEVTTAQEVIPGNITTSGVAMSAGFSLWLLMSAVVSIFLM